ncbi:unnamed protein product [Allacma fusca]|uniref:Uncharacterized protein n=1 Tax=Allacma fusca TaxID=39272 RepID=A0A8J2LJK5_9HEXA|nr:unnamed protein product [Allacma fusca]
MSDRTNTGHYPMDEGGDTTKFAIPGWNDSEQDTVVNVSESTWRKQKETINGSCQTDELKYVDEGAQAAPKNLDKPVQTEEQEEVSLDGKPYPPSLIAFFARMTDQVCEVLEENEDPFLSEVFNDYHQDDDEPISLESEMTKLFQLRNEKITEEAAAYCIAWNKSGSQIAVGYSHESHDGWCSHRMSVSIWSLSRPDSLNTKVPQIELEFSSCISSLDFHPQENTLLAVGLHSGEIALADLSVSSYFIGSSSNTKDDDINAKRKNDCVTEIQSSGHAKQIVALKWIRLSQSNVSQLFKIHPAGSSYALISAATDGYISLWSVSKTGSRMYLEKQFIVSSENLSEEITVGNRYKLGMKELGLTSLSSCGEDPTTFVFSTHGSFIFQGFLLNDAEVSDTSVVRSENYGDDRPLYDPVSNIVVQEIGLIVAIDCSPFHRNLFLYLTKEGSCFVQNLLKPNSPSLSIALEVDAKATDVKWSTRPMMIAIADNNFLRFYDLKEFGESAKPVLELEHEEPLLKIAFNKSRTDLVATSDAAGFVHIWKMPSKLIESSISEIDDLIQLGQSHGKSS